MLDRLEARRRREPMLRALHAEGLSDPRIGKLLGVSSTTVAADREALGLPPGGGVYREDRAHFEALRRRGEMLRAWAALYGFEPGQVTRRRA